MRRLGMRWRAGVVCSVAVGLALAGCGGSDSGSAAQEGGDPVTLRFSYFSGESTPYGQLWSWWMDEVSKRTDGQVEFEPFWDGSLLDAPEVIDGLANARVDIAQVTPVYYPESFPLTNVVELPFVTENVPAVSAAFSQLGESYTALQEEWRKQGLKALAWNAAPGSALGMNAPVDTVEDLRGKRLRALDRGSKVLESAGANLINVPLNELYGALERGLVDGYYGIPFGFVGPLKFTEVSEQLVDPRIGVAAMSALAMSESGWNELPEDVQNVMVEVSSEVPAKQAEFEAVAEDATCEAAQENGVDVGVLPEEEVDALRESGKEQIEQEWIQQAESAGAPGQEFLDEYTTVLEETTAEFDDYETGLQRCVDAITAG